MRSSRSLHFASTYRARFSMSMIILKTTNAGATNGATLPMSTSWSSTCNALSSTGLSKSPMPAVCAISIASPAAAMLSVVSGFMVFLVALRCSTDAMRSAS